MSRDAAEALLETLKRAGSALKGADIKFALAGGCAAYARGAILSHHDVDFVVQGKDVEAALTALEKAGLRRRSAPEDWLVKAFDEDRLVDVIFRVANRPVTEELLDRAQVMEVASVEMPVIDATDLVILWVSVFSEHSCDFGPPLSRIRPLREQVDWVRVVRETADSPYAYAFLVLLEQLDIVSLPDLPELVRKEP